MENKQTALEYIKDNLFWPIDFNQLKRVLERAKEIEKEQIREAYYKGVRDEMQNLGSDFEDYYNETYANDTTKGLPEENSKRRGWHY